MLQGPSRKLCGLVLRSASEGAKLATRCSRRWGLSGTERAKCHTNCRHTPQMRTLSNCQLQERAMGSSASARSAATASGTSPHSAVAAMAQASLREASGFLDKLTSFGFAAGSR